MNTTTTTQTTTTISEAPAATETLIKTANENLQKSLGKDSLDDLVNARTRRSVLLVDVSGSMKNLISTGERRIDALRKVADELLETNPVPIVAFASTVQLVERVPYSAGGSTQMSSAIRYAKDQGGNHIALITDGVSSQYDVLDAAVEFGGVIDTFYIGEKHEHGFTMAKRIAELTGGVCHFADLGKPKELGSRLKGLLGAASETL